VSTGPSAVLAALVAALACFLLTPLAIRAAFALGFVDRPQGYKSHRRATPYLGGVAVLASLALATLLFAHLGHRLAMVLVGAVVLAAIGLLDDRVAVAPRWRVAAEVVLAALLWRSGVRWSPFGVGPLDFAVSALWIVGIVNAVNLMDNMDGAAATVAGVAAAGIGVLALTEGQTAVAVASFAVGGACAGFLPHNLAGPARIFLGDGGSMPLGFLVAALALLAANHGSLRHTAVLAGAMLIALPILDTSLVTISRVRRGTSVLTGGLDHLTHRLLSRAGSPRRVAAGLAAGEAVLALLAIVAVHLGAVTAVALTVLVVAGGAWAIRMLESPGWRPAGAGHGRVDPLSVPLGAIQLGLGPSTTGAGPASVTVSSMVAHAGSVHGGGRPPPRSRTEEATRIP
jgi:UDP-GlcNAc:undecaprenyl-phosphate GlcNAc-1-phosphate transferase